MLPTPVAYRWYGSVREREAIRAMRVLGIHRTQIRLLGFPDEGLCTLASTYRAGPPFESPYTKRESPPEAEQIVRGTMYRGEDLIRELAQLIQQFRPTLVVFAHSGDQHPDHCATHLLAHQALADAVERGLPSLRVLHYVVHYPQWPSAERQDGGIDPPSSEITRVWQWRTLELSAAERAAKAKALETFRSQMLVMPDFLNSFARANELFIEGEPPLPMPCWCGGENIAVATRSVQ
jgi:LmbE family N-acetylglucosaminyl deacetylase